MVDKFAEEISSSLDAGGRRDGGPAPAIVIGVGAFGGACLHRLIGELDDAPRHATVALSLEAKEEVPAGVTFLSWDGRLFARVPASGGTRRDIYQSSKESSSFLADWLKGAVGGLLAADGNTDEAAVRLFIIGRVEETDTAALAVALPEIARDHLADYVSNRDIAVSGFFLLPPGRSPRGALAYSFLGDLRHESGYRQVFLASAANAGGLLDDDGCVDLMAEFAGLMLELNFSTAVSEVMAAAGGPAENRTGLAGFGVTSVVHPVNRIIDEESTRFSLELINSGLLGAAGEQFYRLADEYVKSEGLNVPHLCERLITDGDGTVLERVTVEPLAFTNIPIASWPEHIAGYRDFLARGRMPELIGKIEANLDELSSQAGSRLKAQIDELISEPSALEKAGDFIDRLEERSKALRAEGEQAVRDTAGRAPDLSGRREKLFRRIENLPSPAALTVRGALVTVLIYYFALKFVEALERFPDRYLNPVFLPPAGAAAIVSALGAIAFFWLWYKRAENGLFKARDDYLRAIGDRYRMILRRYAYRLLSSWFAGEEDRPPGGPAEKRRDRHLSWRRAVRDERASVRKLNKLYLRADKILRQRKSEDARTPVRRSVFAGFSRPADLRYKKGRYDLQDEIQRFTVIAHERWRELGLGRLNDLLNDFSRAGLAFIDDRDLETLFMEIASSSGQRGQVFEDLRRRSQPYIAVSPDVPHVAELVGVSGGGQSALAADAELLGQAALVPISSRHRMVFVQLACPIKIEKLAAFDAWRRDYDLAPDKEGLSLGRTEGEAA